jgi:uncharacterized protein YihD (DUF1040 family)
MTEERLEEIFEETDSKWEGDNAFQGLQILAKYTDADVVCAAEHDIIYSVEIAEVIDDLTEEDAIKLAKLNWHIDGEFWCFACFV